MHSFTKPINFKKWIDEHRHLLKPPVGNQTIWEDGDFIVQVVGGPNSRKDFHYNEGPEFFYQLEGQITVTLYVAGKFEDVDIAEGEIFLLPPKIPHCPKRKANTIGLVIEHKRRPDEKDGLLWFCEKCATPLYSEYFHLTNIVTQFKGVFDIFYGDKTLRTCKTCGYVMEPPVPPKQE